MVRTRRKSSDWYYDGSPLCYIVAFTLFIRGECSCPSCKFLRCGMTYFTMMGITDLRVHCTVTCQGTNNRYVVQNKCLQNYIKMIFPSSLSPSQSLVKEKEGNGICFVCNSLGIHSTNRDIRGSMKFFHDLPADPLLGHALQ